MEYLKRDPMPEECRNCDFPECDVCDIGGELWYLPHEMEARVRRKGILMALEHLSPDNPRVKNLKKELSEIEKRLLPFTEHQIDAIERHTGMNQQLLDECVLICLEHEDFEMALALQIMFPLQRKHQEKT